MMDSAAKDHLFKEHDELSVRRSKLEQFMLTQAFDQLAEVDRTDLREQLGHMQAYERVLERRVMRA